MQMIFDQQSPFQYVAGYIRNAIYQRDITDVQKNASMRMIQNIQENVTFNAFTQTAQMMCERFDEW